MTQSEVIGGSDAGAKNSLQKSIIDQILDDGHFVSKGKNPGQELAARRHGKDLLRAFLDELDLRTVVDASTQNAIGLIQQRITELDGQLGAQLDAILHAEPFRELEARWRGLHYLVKNTETSATLKIRVMNASKEELRKDLEAAIEPDRSALFKKVYEEEYGTFGGDPMGLLLGDYDFDGSTPDIQLLSGIAGVAAAAHAPFVAAASPALFDMESFTKLDLPGDLAKLMERTTLAEWRKFRASEDSRYVALTLPRVLLRVPYGPKTAPVEGFEYDEFKCEQDEPGDAIPRHDHFLWGNSAYALAQRITTAFSLHHWCAAIRGVEGGGLVEGLPFYTFKHAGEEVIKCPTEITLTDRRENELSELGFVGLCYKKNSNEGAFFGGSTANKPATYNTPAANANARLSAQLPYILATSRFAHYLKVMMRDKIGSFSSRDSIAMFLNNWIAEYVLLNDGAGQEIKARMPLREARIDVTEVPGKPGTYRAIAFLRPHFQLNELTVSMRLVAELPPPAGG